MGPLTVRCGQVRRAAKLSSQLRCRPILSEHSGIFSDIMLHRRENRIAFSYIFRG